MQDKSNSTQNKEIVVSAFSGWLMLAINLAMFIGGIWLFVASVVNAASQNQNPNLWQLFGGLLLALLAVMFLLGHFTLQPNQARVQILFGAYKGTVRASGFWWANPFYSRIRAKVPVHPTAVSVQKSSHGGSVTSVVHLTRGTKISLRAQNFNSDKLKVNDKRGNPVEIAAVVVWRVEDTAKAAFDVDDYESYVHIQSEAAIRHIASLYAYDRGEEQEPTLRESADEVAAALKKELQERLEKAGVVIEEARLTHLAYAPEIAQAMLRRQQAEAVIAARQKIVHGAVSMVDMALRELSEKAVVKLDEERKAAMVSNLLVVLCGESEASPVINTGTLYN
jgi:regulator of protease activity HflC (stomatin/prohibitin superfamily)